jgi:hypothetical protein
MRWLSHFLAFLWPCTCNAERVMHSGVLTERACSKMVIPAYAGIQAVPVCWIPAGAGMTFHLCISISLATFKMQNTL